MTKRFKVHSSLQYFASDWYTANPLKAKKTISSPIKGKGQLQLRTLEF